MPFTPALVIVDVQEDFCPPHGSLAVDGGRDIVPLLNKLLSMPFAVKVATKDFHPKDHISFASSHKTQKLTAFKDVITIANPLNPEETQETRVWPDHCVQGTKGSELLPEIDQKKIHHIVEKGQDKRVEMYSAFADPFVNPTVSRSNLAQILHDAGVTDVFVAGLAADYCVKFTALDAHKEGFKTWVVSDATRAVDPSALPELYKEYEQKDISVINEDHDALKKVKEYQQKDDAFAGRGDNAVKDVKDSA